jgi:iron complex transport system ATP-binding protein
MTGHALEAASLSFSIGDAAILTGVSFTVREGETWSVLGPNGSGKSTLLKCLMRIHRTWTGRVELFGRSLDSYPQRELARNIAYVPQAGSEQGCPFTVRQFIAMARYPYSGPFRTERRSDNAAVDEAMERTHTTRFARRTLHTLSGGERQKVFIAAALAQGGPIMLLDEPTAFLDYRHRQEVSAIMRWLNNQSGRAIVSVTHDVNAALLLGGMALALREGRVVYRGPVQGLRDLKLLASIYDAEFRFIDDPVTGQRLVAPAGGAP